MANLSFVGSYKENVMGISTRIDLEDGFAKVANTRDGHVNQMRVMNGQAVRDLQRFGLSKGQATAMLDPKRGSRCVGLSPDELAL